MKKFIFICVILLLASPCWATNYYVNGSCTYSGDGTTADCAAGAGQTGAWKTMAAAVSGVPDAANHTINVAAGTYAETVTDTRSGISPGYRYWLASVIDTVTVQRFYLNGSYVKIEGFTFTGPLSGWDGAVQFGTDSSYNFIESCNFSNTNSTGISGGINSAYITINNCVFYKCLYDAINMDTSNDHWTISNNDISHTYAGTWGGGSAGANGINLGGSNHHIIGNYIHDILHSEAGNDAHIDGIQWNGPDSGSGTVIERNRFYLMDPAVQSAGGTTAFMMAGGVGTIIKNNLIIAWAGYNTGGSGTPQSVKIYNNTWISSLNFLTFGQDGIEIDGGTGHEVKNNIIAEYDNASRGSRHISFGDVSGHTCSNNLLWNSDSSTPVTYNYSSTGDVSSDPKFIINFTDLHLQSSSPAKDAGATIESVTDDYAGTTRPKGAGYDIGAYEFSAYPSAIGISIKGGIVK